MIATAWRVVGIGFSLVLVVAAAVLAGADPWQGSLGGTFATPEVFIGLDLRTDDLTALLLAVVGVVATCVQVYSIGYLHGQSRIASYTALVTLFSAAMATVVVADNLFLLLIGWEVMGACSYLLISQYWERRDARSGAMKAFLMTRLGDVGFLFGIFVLGLGAGTFRISELRPGEMSAGTLTAGTLLLLVGVVGKSAQVPLQTWLPDAMPGPSPVSALIHAATMVAAGVYLIARLYGIFAAAEGTLTVLAAVAAVTMVFAACCALAAVEVKRVLAWSTVSQLAIMFAGLSLGTVDGRHAAVFHLVTHAAFKGLLFLCAGVLLHQVGSAAFAVLQGHTRQGGLRRALPVTFVTMTIGLGALAGVPGLAGFFSKDAVVEAAWHTARDGSAIGWLVLIAVSLTTVLTAFYCGRLWLWVFFRTPVPGGAGDIFDEVTLVDAPAAVTTAVAGEGTAPAPARHASGAGVAVSGATAAAAMDAEVAAEVAADEFDPSRLRDAPWSMLGPLVLLAAGAVALGYAEGPHLDPGIAALTTALAALGAAGAYGLWRRGADPRPVVLEREFGVDAAYQRLVVTPVRWLAGLTVAGDRDVIGAYVRGSGRVGVLASAGLRRLQTANVQTYLTAAVVGVVALAIVAGVIGA